MSVRWNVGDMVSDSFGVVSGLRQGCVLSPWSSVFIVYKLTSEHTQHSRGSCQMQRPADPGSACCILMIW